MTLFEEIKKENIQYDTHESDIYIRDNECNREIVAHYPTHEKNASTFICAITGARMIDIPFAFDGFWK